MKTRFIIVKVGLAFTRWIYGLNYFWISHIQQASLYPYIFIHICTHTQRNIFRWRTFKKKFVKNVYYQKPARISRFWHQSKHLSVGYFPKCLPQLGWAWLQAGDRNSVCVSPMRRWTPAAWANTCSLPGCSLSRTWCLQLSWDSSPETLR